MEIIIGRDTETSKLSVTIGQQKVLTGTEGSVPKSVSRAHCKVVINADGTYEVRNMKAQNVTYLFVHLILIIKFSIFIFLSKIK